jgi:hypothetical protein
MNKPLEEGCWVAATIYDFKFLGTHSNCSEIFVNEMFSVLLQKRSFTSRWAIGKKNEMFWHREKFSSDVESFTTPLQLANYLLVLIFGKRQYDVESLRERERENYMGDHRKTKEKKRSLAVPRGCVSDCVCLYVEFPTHFVILNREHV